MHGPHLHVLQSECDPDFIKLVVAAAKAVMNVADYCHKRQPSEPAAQLHIDSCRQLALAHHYQIHHGLAISQLRQQWHGMFEE